jgi:hypothetical protein
MNLKQFKKLVLDKELTNAPIYLEYPDNTFLVNKYLDKILEIKKKESLYVDDLNILDTGIEDNFIYVYKTDKLESVLDIPNLIVIFKSIDSKIESQLKELDYYIKFPTLQEWHIKDYIKVKCPKLEEKDINYIYSKGKDIYKIDNIVSILSLFKDNSQKREFEYLKGILFEDKQEIFDLTNCLIKRDASNIKIDYNINPMALINLLVYNFKNIISIQMSKNATAESLGMNIRQFNALKYNCGKYQNKELINILKFLVGLDRKVKNGFLIEDNLLDYIICNVLNGGIN